MTFLSFRLIFLAAAAALLLSPLAVRLGRRLGFIDVPGSLPHKQHDRPVPLVGGWALLAAVLLAAGWTLVRTDATLRAILLASAIVFVLGLVDDYRGLSAPVKLLAQAAAAAALIGMGVQVSLLPPAWTWANLAITMFWLVGVTNAYNFVDSMDGLAVGLAGLAAAFFMLAAQDAGQFGLSSFSAALLGACIGVYFFNAQPARFFLGDAGSQWLGFVLAGIGLAYTPPGFLRSQSWFVPILIVGVPIFDTSLILFSRLRRGLPWYRAQMDHTYHRMVRFGLVSSRAVLAMHLAELLLSCLAFILLSLRPVLANAGFGLILAAGAGAVLWMDSRSRWA